MLHIPTREEIIAHMQGPVFAALRGAVASAGVEAYVVGGYVRDLLLGRPSQDVDVVCVGRGEDLAHAFAAQLGRGARLSVFRTYGTAQVKWHGQEVEFVGARSESYTPESRNPKVAPGTLRDDQRRRDFTVNALAVSLVESNYGELIDPFGGVDDLEDRLLATPLDPDITFSDDPLRMMRCVRFAAQLAFQIEDETFEAIGRNVERIDIVSRERIVVEMEKLLMSPRPSIGLVEMQRSGLMARLLPEVAALDVVETREGRSHKNNFYHTLEVLDTVSAGGGSLWLRWAALLHDIGKPRSKRWEAGVGWTFHNHNFLGERMVPPLFRRMKLPQDERMKYVAKLVGLHMRPIALADEGVSDSGVRRLLFEAGNDVDDLMQLCEADVTSKNEVRKQGFLQNFQRVRRRLVEIEEKDRIRNFQPPVDGEEIMRLFHLKPSREVGVLKTALKDAVLDGLVPNEHDAALAFIRERARELLGDA